ncbi:hypothetical protein AQUCO_01700281v1 [Aquilegia coerulea]|uniref:Pentacotripeptide-repeat region of PRORP domain-containing protein n=1 Tax=Aquilegia coerulea TaxID=218851 RepID=A0A2G5DM42_AQUCA|nr:hypothetical protein AQUCO_01700281v1 [Aquilegia coerulea]
MKSNAVGLWNKTLPVIIAGLIQACIGIGSLRHGKCVHGWSNGFGMSIDILVVTSLIDMYGKLDDIESASQLFNRMPTRNLVSWNTILSGYMACFLQGCAQLSSLCNGKVLHGSVLRRGLESNIIVTTALVDLYVKSGALKLASSVFDAMKEKNVISWTTMLMGLVQNGHAEEAFRIFCQMQEERVDVNAVTFVSLIHGCAYAGSLKKGRSIHAYLTRKGFLFDEILRTALIDMYGKCACSRSGLVEDGLNLFHTVRGEHGILPNKKHYACLVDLLGRAGKLEEAEALIEQMPFEPDSAVFEALLSGCQMHKNINIGIKTAHKLLSLDAMNPGIYVVLSNIYAEGGRWSEVDYVRDLMRKRGLRKTPGYSMIEVAYMVHTFLAGDDSHPYWDGIYPMLEDLRKQIEDSGCVPDT